MSRPMAASELPHCGNPKTNRIGDAANLPTIYYTVQKIFSETAQ